MLVRAGASNAPMVGALGVDINRLFMVVFGFGRCWRASPG
jgi:branched-chain amino acid transport system permease protein